MGCAGCERVAAGRASPFFLADLRESVAVLHPHQAYRGWCVLWLKEHAEHLHALEPQRQARLWLDVNDVARAAAAVTGCRRLNYENLGNVVGHVHWHVIPRYQPPIDPDPKAPVWVRGRAALECGVSDAERDALAIALRARLGPAAT